MDRKRRPSLQDVASIAGVSTATVSAVINNRTGTIRVSEPTRERILEAARETGYVANPAARGLAGAKNRIIGVFTYESVFPFAHRDFYYPFLLAIESAAERNGYDLLFMTSATGSDRRRSIYQAGANRLWLADGAILLGLEKDEEELARLVREHYPFVIIGHRDVPGVELSYVAADYTSATASIVNSLFRKGHTRVSLLRVPQDSEPGNDREAGYRRAYEEAGMSVPEELVYRVAPERISSGFLDKLLDQGVTACVAERYSIAESLLTVANLIDLEVPRDLSVSVLGGPYENERMMRNWNTLITPAQDMALNAFQMVLELMESPEVGPQRTTLPCSIVEGQTVGAPRSKV